MEEAIGLWHKVVRPVGRPRDKLVRRDYSMDSRWHPSRRGLAAILIRNRGVGWQRVALGSMMFKVLHN